MTEEGITIPPAILSNPLNGRKGEKRIKKKPKTISVNGTGAADASEVKKRDMHANSSLKVDVNCNLDELLVSLKSATNISTSAAAFSSSNGNINSLNGRLQESRKTMQGLLSLLQRKLYKLRVGRKHLLRKAAALANDTCGGSSERAGEFLNEAFNFLTEIKKVFTFIHLFYIPRNLSLLTPENSSSPLVPHALSNLSVLFKVDSLRTGGEADQSCEGLFMDDFIHDCSEEEMIAIKGRRRIQMEVDLEILIRFIPVKWGKEDLLEVTGLFLRRYFDVFPSGSGLLDRMTRIFALPAQFPISNVLNVTTSSTSALPMEAFIAILFQRCIFLICKSKRAKDVEGGVALLQFCALFYSVTFRPSANEGEESIRGPIIILQALQRLLLTSLTNIKLKGLVIGSRETPLNGILEGMDCLLSGLLASLLSSTSTLPFDREEVLILLDEIKINCKRASLLCLDVVSSDSPECSQLACVTNIAGTSQDGDEGSQHLLRHCFKSLASSTSLLSTIVSMHSFLFPEAHSSIFLNQSKDIGDFLIKLVSCIRHRGAFAGTEEASATIATVLGTRKEFGILEGWLNDLLSQIEMLNVSITRRSAGLPAALLSVICGPPLLKDRAVFVDKCVSYCFTVLKKLSLLEEDKEQETEGKKGLITTTDLPQVHTLNILKSILSNSSLTSITSEFILPSFILCLHTFKSSVWAIRNCGVMLYTCLLKKIVGVKRSNFKDGEEEAGIEATHFFQRYPDLYEVLLRELKEATVPLGIGMVSPTIFPILSILARLKSSSPSSEDGKVKQYDMVPFRDLVGVSLQSSHWKVRECAARTISNLLTPIDVIPFVRQICTTIFTERSRSNLVHGHVVLLKSICSMHFERMNNQEKNAMAEILLTIDCIVLEEGHPVARGILISLIHQYFYILTVGNSITLLQEKANISTIQTLSGYLSMNFCNYENILALCKALVDRLYLSQNSEIILKLLENGQLDEPLITAFTELADFNVDSRLQYMLVTKCVSHFNDFGCSHSLQESCLLLLLKSPSSLYLFQIQDGLKYHLQDTHIPIPLSQSFLWLLAQFFQAGRKEVWESLLRKVVEASAEERAPELRLTAIQVIDVIFKNLEKQDPKYIDMGLLLYRLCLDDEEDVRLVACQVISRLLGSSKTHEPLISSSLFSEHLSTLQIQPSSLWFNYHLTFLTGTSPALLKKQLYNQSGILFEVEDANQEKNPIWELLNSSTCLSRMLLIAKEIPIDERNINVKSTIALLKSHLTLLLRTFKEIRNEEGDFHWMMGETKLFLACCMSQAIRGVLREVEGEVMMPEEEGLIEIQSILDQHPILCRIGKRQGWEVSVLEV